MKVSRGFKLFLPSFIFLFAVAIFPIIFVFALAFCKWMPPLNFTFVGLENFRAVLNDPMFFESYINTLLIMFPSLLLEFSLSIGVALLLTSTVKISKLIRKIIFLPFVFVPVILGIFARILFGGSYGTVNAILSTFGIQGLDWLGSVFTARLTIIVTETYKWFPLTTLIIFAGLQTISKSLYEAARIDGASRWETFGHITCPLIKNVLLIIFAFRLIWSFQIFQIPFGLTEGGPGVSTYTIGFHIYDVTFREFNFGKGAAESVIFTFIILPILAYLTNLITKRR